MIPEQVQKLIETYKPHTEGYQKVRSQGLKALQSLSYPSPRDDNWKYTDVSNLLDYEFENQNGSELSEVDHIMDNAIDGHHIVFIDGLISKRFSTFQGKSNASTCESVIQAEKKHSENTKKYVNEIVSKKEYFSMLNSALFIDGLYLYLESNIVYDRPIIITYIISRQNNPSIVHPRNCIIVGEHTKVDIIFNYVSQNNTYSVCNSVSEVYIKKGAHARITHLNNGTPSIQNINSFYAKQEAESTLSTFYFDLGNGLNRNTTTLTMDSLHSMTNVYGLSLLQNNQVLDNCTILNHLAPYCESNEHFKGLYTDSASGVFNGTIFVAKDAQKTNAFQQNDILLLSDNAKSYSKPALKIYADDVKCSHGATAGQIDQNALFYLMSRGISREKAFKMLLYAFTDEITRKIEHDETRSYITDVIHSRLNTITIS